MTEFFQWLVGFIKEFKFFTTILPWEVAVRTRLGKHVALWAPGWHVRLPFLDDVKIINTRLRVVHTAPQTVTTQDGKQLTIAFVIGFSITQPLKTLLRLIEPETTVAAFVQSAAADYTWEHPASSINIRGFEKHLETTLLADIGKDLDLKWIRIADFAIAKTYRLIQSTEYGRSGTSTGERVL